MTATQPNYLSISRRALDVEDYMDIARRHVGWILGPVFAGLVISTVVAFLLPNTYESRASMQITPAQVSSALVPTTNNQQLAERVVQMEGDIMSRQSLSNLIQSPALDLYAAERKKRPIDDVIEDMKKDLRIELNAVAGDRHAPSFAISFFYPNKVKAQATVQALITRFNEENESSQRNQQTTLKEMFSEEVTNAKATLQRASESVTKFKIQNQGRLPEQAAINLQALSSLQLQLQGDLEAIRRTEQQRTALETQLTSLNSALQFAQSMAQETPGANTPQARQNESLLTLNRQIEDGELRLQQMLLQFKETWPEVRTLRSTLQILKSHRDELAAKQQSDMAAEETALQNKNAQRKLPPQVLATLQGYQEKIGLTQAALKNNDVDRDFRIKDQERLTKEIQQVRDRLAPSGVEAQLAYLMGEQANANEAYQKALVKQQIANQSGEVVQRRAGELLQVLDSPSLPQKESRPRRGLIIGGGVGLSLIVGFALAALQEVKDTSLKNLKDVRAYTNLPVLGSIPLLENTLLVKRKRRIAYLGWSAAVIVGVIAVCSAIFYYLSVTVNT